MLSWVLAPQNQFFEELVYSMRVNRDDH
jgi:hypothetical protein